MSENYIYRPIRGMVVVGEEMFADEHTVRSIWSDGEFVFNDPVVTLPENMSICERVVVPQSDIEMMMLEAITLAFDYHERMRMHTTDAKYRAVREVLWDRLKVTPKIRPMTIGDS